MQKKIIKYRNNTSNPTRRKTIPVRVGNAVIGGEAPILVQSMVNTPTRDVDATVAQIVELAEAGCELVRITVPTVKDASALAEIVKKTRELGIDIPMSADIHFKPDAAFESLKWMQKVRINPGNFCDTGILSSKKWSEEEFAKGQERVKVKFGAFVKEAKKRNVAIRIGVNHGSLSGRMVYRYGDTVEGMIESALEYLKVCEEEDYDQVVFSLKSSNPRISIQIYRQLVARLESEGHKPYPIHLGVTEAGAGVDARLKSAIGIGGLLQDGLGDTIRVSLTESPAAEIPVAQDLVNCCIPNGYETDLELQYNPFIYTRRASKSVPIGNINVGGNNIVAVGGGSGCKVDETLDRSAEWSYADLRSISAIDIADITKNFGDRTIEIFFENIEQLNNFDKDFDKKILDGKKIIWSFIGEKPLSGYRALMAFLQKHDLESPILLKAYTHGNGDMLEIAAWMGSLLCDGFGDAILILDSENKADLDSTYNILQAAGVRRTKAEYVSCPSCGRTLFDLETVLSEIQERTGHLKDVVIAVMGCIVNGPGEMAAADFGYVGGAPGKISLYEGRTLVKKNIPQKFALDELVELLKSRGKWTEPTSKT